MWAYHAQHGVAGRYYGPLSGIRRQVVKLLYHRVLHADDSPHRIALGVGIATFVAFTPTMGFQTVIALAVAAALRANKADCIPLVWITNPFTFVPIYWFCWRIGAGVLPGGNTADAGRVMAKLSSAASVATFSRMLEWSFWARGVKFMLDLGVELWLGCCLVGLVSGGALYGLSLWGVSEYRRRRAARRMRFNAGGAKNMHNPSPSKTAAGVRKSA